MLKSNNLYLGDCLDLLAKIEDQTIDLVFLDPPYNLQLNRVLTRPNHSIVNGVNQDWDKFDSYSSYDDFTFSYLTECKRVLKKDKRNKMVITDFVFFSAILDEKLNSPSRSYDTISYPGKKNKYFKKYKTFLLDNIKRKNIKVIYMVNFDNSDENLILYDFIDRDCLEREIVSKELKKFELKKC